MPKDIEIKETDHLPTDVGLSLVVKDRQGDLRYIDISRVCRLTPAQEAYVQRDLNVECAWRRIKHESDVLQRRRQIKLVSKEGK